MHKPVGAFETYEEYAEQFENDDNKEGDKNE